MDLVVAGVGTRMPGWVADGWREYARRMPPQLPMQLVEVPAAGKAGAGRESALEAERLLEKLPDRARIVALESRRAPGRPRSSRPAWSNGSSMATPSGS